MRPLCNVNESVEALPKKDKASQAKAVLMKSYASWTDVPEVAFDKIVRLGVVLDRVEEYRMDAIAHALLDRAADSGWASRRASLIGEMNERPGAGGVRGGHGQCGDHAPARRRLGRPGRVPGLEQQLRRR